MHNKNEEFNFEEVKHKLLRGSIWYIDLGEQKGSIQAGVRPCIPVSNQKNLDYSPTFQIVALTSQVKKGLPTHMYLNQAATGLRTKSIALCEQVITVNKTDIKGYVSQMSDKYIELINKGLRIQLALEDNIYKEEIKEEEIKSKQQQEKFSFEYAQELIETIAESESIYKKLNSNLALNMIKQYVTVLLGYCLKFGRPCELYKRRYSKYLEMEVREMRIDLILAK